ncbi:MAG: PglZ domain protein [Planctomycetes bacterium ADurb.Bin401]|nr:MAG: PglZ domain protein [Planctomycetes bacterium ADurb.Bin401]
MRVIDVLTSVIKKSGTFNLDAQVAPFCILWPDKDRQWEAAIPRLQNEIPELLVLGDYAPDKKIGPAIWLRCVIANKASGAKHSENTVPVIYLPGVSRQDLRAVESCPDNLKPLAELQYRGVIWSQESSRDWTIMAFAVSKSGGLGLDVAKDSGTKNAMLLALNRFIDEDIKPLTGKHLDSDFFNSLITGGDHIRDMLKWLDNEELFKKERNDNEWKAFVELCKSQLGFNPDKEGLLSGAAKLASQQGAWASVWERYLEAPAKYAGIPKTLRKCLMPQPDLYSNEQTHGGWPQWNEEQENLLNKELKSLGDLPAHKARAKIEELKNTHIKRLGLVWAELGLSPMAKALEHIAVIAEITSNSLTAGNAEDLASIYLTSGWKADDAVIKALASVDKPDDIKAVRTAIRSIYMPWAEDAARYLQSIVEKHGYPGGNISTSKTVKFEINECMLFVDGLRLDVARNLAEKIINRGYKVNEKPVWAALPSVTATGKPAVSPVRDKISGQEQNDDFDPCVSKTGHSLKGGYHFDSLMVKDGWEILERTSTGQNKEKAWCESGNIDNEGHARGSKMAKHLESIINEIVDRIEQLLNNGWKSVKVVTDHGWLFLPGGLPKIELPVSLVENKWGRCASIKAGATTKEKQYPWFWNPQVYFALADGISCFHKNEEYAHGGLSLQECLVLELTITQGASSQSLFSTKITEVSWKNLRCTVVIEGSFEGTKLDIRVSPGDPATSIVAKIKPFQDDGTTSVVVEDADFEGKKACILILDEKGSALTQAETIIGGGKK